MASDGLQIPSWVVNLGGYPETMVKRCSVSRAKSVFNRLSLPNLKAAQSNIYIGLVRNLVWSLSNLCNVLCMS